MNTFKVGLLLTALTLLFVLLGGWLGGSTGMVLALVLALVMNGGSYWYSDRIVLRMTGAEPLAREAAPALYAVTERLAARAGIPTPGLYLVPDPQPNAFATGRNPERGVVAVNQGLLDLLSPEEVEGVIAHEIAHIANRDTLTMTVAASLAGAVMTLVNLAQWGAVFGASDEEEGPGLLGLLVAALVAPLAATLIQLAVSRAREFEADASAAAYTGTPHGLIGALRTLERGAALVPSTTARPATAHLSIVNPLAGGAAGGFARLFSTHPPTGDRVAALRALDLTAQPRRNAPRRAVLG
ncbi:MAG: M48 family metalloprotease [Salinivenus sp.]